MIFERNLTPYIVFAEDPIVVGLQKISANQQRIVFCVDEHGRLRGSLSDGDFRRWIVANPTASLDVTCVEVANTSTRTAPATSTPSELAPLLGHGGITHLPLVDETGHLIAVAIDRNDVLRIGRHEIGAGHPAFVIAEIGNNHNGDVDLAKRLVDLAADAGADAVKFQLRDMDALYRQSGGSTAGEDLGAQYTLDLLSRVSLPAEKLFTVFDHARDRGVDLMCTPWDGPSVQALVDYGIEGLKIASADLTNHELLRDAGSRGLPLILSTGMSRESEILETVGLMRSLGSSFALLHCQSTYPAPFKDINLAYLDRLAEIGDSIVGYSGHERGWHVPVAAVARGARIIEKHFTVDRGMEGNDHTVSLLPDEFAQMVEQIRDIELSLGDAAPREVSTGELMNRTTLAKSLVAARELREGEVLRAEDIAVKSPGRGLQPNRLDELVGRAVNHDMAEGEFFFESDLTDTASVGREFEFRRPWGLPVRYHDYKKLIENSTPDFLEFHFSYKDLEVDIDSFFTEPLDMDFTTHLPDLFSGDFLVDLASTDDEHWERSIREVQRTIDTTRSLKKWFTRSSEPIMVVTMGGFTKDKHVPAQARTAMYARIADAVQRLDTDGVRIAAQTLPPFPWLMGGQQFHNLFLDPHDTAEFSATTGTKLCFDVSHSKLAANFLGMQFSDYTELVAPHSIHLHLVDATGVDGEGVQVGDGEVDWPLLAGQLDEFAPGAPFIPEIWQGHIDNGQGFWTALDRLEKWL
ncbi:acetylneuraminic acid synthetase [Pseudoclavibacter sp. RFBJ3]|uniref:N-acetylneuraminate synthase family protein n=1 Tax=unclassified Pseudoclavibacter TaxID=2615177 RepID=UPI000CE86054|nr:MULTISPECIES: N-acetylneuraminate synthase family protein [unclassified Pseudoclavibacter]MBF4550307.1 N-acetylneuraminate synthase family protein [Pseudoclavibacter sp. VKM Ac-2888]PPF82006.1 acetylneuraminic acid synthetase [Pseudoclavibacter sp. RFBJ5]PPF94756.1 acetylneuraminic acid synthetase [Pseudoclavibacter sp. RFBJ3]PPF95980.1 acetylneuraminic acid synthetase [Pseudoclavibacter sp. RFBH5]PPG05239.1 acetylneuraminic acid synthetase [Pseudoclavibacter sp. RFBI5]